LSVCSGKGTCNKPDECTCIANYDGNECQDFIAPQNQKKIYTYGSNGEGDLGIGTTQSLAAVPTLIDGVYPGIMRIFNSKDNAGYFLTKKYLYGFGKNRVTFYFYNPIELSIKINCWPKSL
jgi:hypothetical protein